MEKDSHAQRNNTKSHESTFKNVKKTDTGSWKLFNKLHRLIGVTLVTLQMCVTPLPFGDESLIYESYT